jgi:hypothetical protein
MDYSKATAKLIDRMCKNVEREDFTLDKKRGAEAILKTYDLFGLDRPKKIVWVKDIFDKRFDNAARSARFARSAWSARSARFAWSAMSAGSARSAMSAMSAGSAGSARFAWSAMSARFAWSAMSAGFAWSAGFAIDYDFDWYVIEHEYCKNRRDNPGDEPNENDRKYIQYSELLMQAKEYGVGYRVEWKDTLYLVPTPLVKIDEENRFHSEDSPAIRWKGGKEFYFWHGVSVKEKLIRHPEKLTKKNWMDEKNIEVRRCIQEKLGERFVTLLKGKTINKGKRGELIEIDLKDDPDKVAHYVKVKDTSTARQYYLRVPPTITDADTAVSWTFNKTVQTYLPVQEA